MSPDLREKLAGRRVIASVSGGKDSAALSLWLHEQGIEHDRVFLDTGWEHPATYEYLRGELARVIGPITEVRAERQMVELVRTKGTFPSGRRRWCTQHLKVEPMKAHLRALMDAGDDVVNAVGVRGEESARRAAMPEWEWSADFDCEIWRPLIRWTEGEIVLAHKRHGLRPNPLYLLGASRVGCWPCVYAPKAELRLIADADPARIEQLAALEAELSEKAGEPRAWFQKRPARWEGGKDSVAEGGSFPPWPIHQAVEWARTSRGGRQFELLAADPRDAGCMRWGLCDTGKADPEEKP